MKPHRAAGEPTLGHAGAERTRLMRRDKRGLARAVCGCTAALAALLLTFSSAWAHIDPPGASQSGAGQRIGLFTDSTCTTPLETSILNCQTIYVKATLVW